MYTVAVVFVVYGKWKLLPTVKGVMFYLGLFVCLSVRRINKNVVNGFKEISWLGRAWPRNRVIKF